MSVEQSVPQGRLHALDAVRGYALLLGVVLHSCAAFLQDFPFPQWRLQPEPGPALIYYGIHVFRMSAFFLMAGFFGRMLLERRGVGAFVADRSKRILLPLVVGLPIVLVITGCFMLLGALPHGGIRYLVSLAGGQTSAAVTPPASALLDLQHLWFLYYLLMFYAVALEVRALLRLLDGRGALQRPTDRFVRFPLAGPWGAVLLALPAALYYWPAAPWNEWTGLPAPSSIVPDLGGFIAYLVPFGLGWLLQRQVPTLLALRRSWLLYLVLFAALTALCLSIIGTTPRWQGPALHGSLRAIYIASYMVAVWRGVFAAVGASVRFLSAPSPVTRYLADASYWVYLMHMAAIVFFISLLRPYDLQWHLHWTLMLVLMVGGTMLILLPGYHHLVRFTWVGAILNGSRRPRTAGRAAAGAAALP